MEVTPEQLAELKKKSNLTMKEKLILAKAEADVSVSSRNTTPERSMFSVKTEQARLEFVKIADIKPNPFQPRKHPSKKEVDELEALIKREGLLQPILVTKRGGEIVLIAGQKRLMVFDRCNKDEQEKGLETIEMKYFKIACLVIDNCTDLEMATMALVENEGRKNPLFLDTANAIKTHFEMSKKEEDTLSQNQYTQIAAKVFNIGSKGTVSKYLKIATLEQEVQEEVFKIEFNQFTKLYEIAKSGLTIEEKIQELYREDEKQLTDEEIDEEDGENAIPFAKDDGQAKAGLETPSKTKEKQTTKEQGEHETKKSKSKIDIDYLIDTIQNLDATVVVEDKERIKEEIIFYLREFQ